MYPGFILFEVFIEEDVYTQKGNTLTRLNSNWYNYIDFIQGLKIRKISVDNHIFQYKFIVKIKVDYWTRINIG